VLRGTLLTAKTIGMAVVAYLAVNLRGIGNRLRALMRMFALVGVVCVLTGSAFAHSPSCKAQAGEKKLAGAALTSFMKKCE
jgi:hypothetical protein